MANIVRFAGVPRYLSDLIRRPFSAVSRRPLRSFDRRDLRWLLPNTALIRLLTLCFGLHRVAGHQLFSRPVALSSILMPRKTIVLSAVSNKRLYGPEEAHEQKDEVHHWVNERYAAVALLPLIPAALAFPNFILDTLLTSAMVLHTHWRLSGVAQDYIHGEILPKIARPLVYVLTVCAFGSICYFNYTDIGFANAARLLYTQL